MNILVTGGAGYIGTHTVVELINAGHNVVVYDNLYNSSEESIHAVEKLLGRHVNFIKGDINDDEKLVEVFREYSIDTVIDFAAFKSVSESVEDPLKYFYNNINGLVVLLDCMRYCNVKNMIFSSSATVYGYSEKLPFTENHPKGEPTNPYGRTKSVGEDILSDLAKFDPSWNICILRYFNPVGAHPSGIIGEDPNGIPANLMPYISKVAVGELPELSIFGDDYDTPDGTCIRDYIHVVDLAKAHVAALRSFNLKGNLHIYNVGTGSGTSVFELLDTFMIVNDVAIPYVVRGRRPGDVAVSYCSPKLIKDELGWEAELTVEDMCIDAFNWQVNNPKGYGSN